MKNACSLFTFIIISTSFTNVFSQAGSPDPSFGTNGKAITDFISFESYASAAAMQPDGRIVTVGYTINSADDQDFALARYNTNGTLDVSFNNDGKQTTAVGTSNDNLWAVAIQSDGKIVVAGSSQTGGQLHFSLARYHTNGSLDNTFDGDGKLTTVIGNNSEAFAMAIQADGKIVAAGRTSNGGAFDFVIVRYNSNGSLDAGFDTDGRVTTDFAGFSDIAWGIALQTDGKIVVSGNSNNGTDNDFALARYNTDGSLDAAFDLDGKVTTAIGPTHDFCNAVAIQSDGKIIAGGSSRDASFNDDFALARYNADGSPDLAFDTDGKQIVAIGSMGDVIRSVRLQADGKIIAAGHSYIGSGGYKAMARFHTDGSLDTGFDGDGKVVTTEGSSFAYSAIIQSDGKIILAGGTFKSPLYHFSLERYNTDGSADNTFSTDGKLTTTILSSHEYATAMSVQSDGKIIVAGTSARNGSQYDFALTRHHANGFPDGSFGTGGKVTTDMGSSTDNINAIAIQADGKIVVAGSAIVGPNHDFALARYNTNGSLDVSFDVDGKVTTALSTGPDVAFAVVIQDDGKIVAAGYSRVGFYNKFAIARYNTNGSLDASFDLDGIVTTSFFASSTDIARTIVVQSDGKIVLAGMCNNGNIDFALARYNTDGSLDISFDGDGILTTPIGSSMDEARSVALQADGKIVVGGYSHNGMDSDFALARYLTNGSMDITFDGDGKLVTAIGISEDEASSVAMQNDGKIVAAGMSLTGASLDFAAVRYHTDGSLDADFDGDGKAIYDLAGGDDNAYAMKLFSNRIYVSGVAVSEGVGDFGLISIINDAQPLPLSLLSFTGQNISGNGFLRWKTTSEFNTHSFDIERSIDGRNYSTIGNVAASNTPGEHQYMYSDKNIWSLGAAVVYYRLKQKDTDSRFGYSGIVALSINKSSIVLLYPNPVINEANLTITLDKPEQVRGRILDDAGRLVKQMQWDLPAGSASLRIDVKSLAQGIYFLELKGETVGERRKFIKQ